MTQQTPPPKIHPSERILNFTADDLRRIERQLIPLLNTIRQLQGKRPIVLPGEKRTDGRN